MKMDVMTTGVKAFLYLLLLSLAFFLVMYVKRVKPVQRVRDRVEELDRKRVLEAEKPKEEAFQRFMEELDEKLTQSGVKRFIPKAAVEIYLLFNILEFSLLFCLMDAGIMVPLLTAALAVYFNKLVLDILIYRNNKVVERHMLEFMNLVSDYSISEGEITSIFYKAGQSMPNPLRRLLVTCHLSARSSGDSEAALEELRRSVDHFLFKRLLLLLELCSKSTGDYQVAVNKCRDMVSGYLREEKEKLSIIKGLIGEILIMTAVTIYGISIMLQEFTDGAIGTMTMTEFFLHQPAGQITLLVYVGLIFAMVQVIMKFAKGR